MILGLIGVAIGSVIPIDYPPTSVTEKTVVCNYPEWTPYAEEPERPHLTKSGGVFAGPSGKETYYNLPMGKVCP